MMMASPAILSLDENAQNDLIVRIAPVSAEKQEALIAVFEKERADLDNVQKTKIADIDQDIAQINSLMQQLNELEHQYDAAVRGYAEVKSQANDQVVLSQLEQQLNEK